MVVVGLQPPCTDDSYQSRQKFLNGRQAPGGAENERMLSRAQLTRSDRNLPRQRAESHPFADKLDPEQHT
jgi:hypothetical protein